MLVRPLPAQLIPCPVGLLAVIKAVALPAAVNHCSEEGSPPATNADGFLSVSYAGREAGANGSFSGGGLLQPECTADCSTGVNEASHSNHFSAATNVNECRP